MPYTHIFLCKLSFLFPAVCEYYAHIECQDFVVSDCKECATYIPQRDLVSFFMILLIILLFISLKIIIRKPQWVIIIFRNIRINKVKK